MYVLLDIHTCSINATGAGEPGAPVSATQCAGYTVDKWIADLKTLATLSLTYTNVIGIDLFNEPYGLTWQDWSTKYVAPGGQAILAINPNITIWVEGVGSKSPSGNINPNWGENLYESGAITGVSADRLVFAPHAYGPGVAAQDYFKAANYPANMTGVWDTLFGHLVDDDYTVVMGEYGGRYVTSSDSSQNDKLWQDSFVTYLISKGMKSNFYWCVNPDSGDTGGIYSDDWKTWNTDKLALLQRLMQ